MIISIIIALLVWFVIPILLEDKIKKKNHKKATKATCMILGVVIIVMSIVTKLIGIVTMTF